MLEKNPQIDILSMLMDLFFWTAPQKSNQGAWKSPLIAKPRWYKFPQSPKIMKNAEKLGAYETA
jgi:hypothetical protein